MTSHANRAKILDVREQRACVEKFEYREAGNQIVLEGYAATYEPYDCYGGVERGGWVEQLQPTAFDVTLATSPDVQLLINHEGCPLARTKSGTMQLSRDRHGLRVRAILDGTDPDVKALVPKMRRGDMDEMSFGFRVKDQVWDTSYTHRTITEVSLAKGDVSVVNYGMNPTTSALINVDALAQLSDGDLAELRKMDPGKLERAMNNLRQAGNFGGKKAKPFGSDDEDEDERDDTCPGGDKCPGDNCPDHDTRDHIFAEGLCVTCAEDRAKDPKKPYGDVAYADPKNGKYPIDTKAHVKAAWSYINMPKNQKGYTSAEVAAIKGRIKSAAKKFGIEISEDKKSYYSVSDVKKSYYSTPTPANLAGPRVEMVRDKDGRESLVAIMPDGSQVPLPSARGSAFKGAPYVWKPGNVTDDPHNDPYDKEEHALPDAKSEMADYEGQDGAHSDDYDEDIDEHESDVDNPHDEQIDLGLVAALESTIVKAYKLSLDNGETTQTLLADAAKLVGRMRPRPSHESPVERQLRELRDEAGLPNFSTVNEGLAYLREQRAG